MWGIKDGGFLQTKMGWREGGKKEAQKCTRIKKKERLVITRAGKLESNWEGEGRTKKNSIHSWLVWVKTGEAVCSLNKAP